MLRLTRRNLSFKSYHGDKPRTRPVITRTRSWRGIMQVRYDDTRADRQQFMRHFFLWAPLRVVATGLTISMFLYFYLGHDQYMYQMFGYESEAYLEHRRHVEPIHLPGDLMFNDRRAFRNIRDNETPTHDKRTFPVFRPDVAERAVGEAAKRMPGTPREFEDGVDTTGVDTENDFSQVQLDKLNKSNGLLR